MKALPARSWYYYIKVTGDGRGIGCHHIWGIDMYVCIEKRHFLCMLQVFKLLTMRFFCSLDVTWFLHFYTSDKQPQCFPHRRSYSGILTTTQVYLSTHIYHFIHMRGRRIFANALQEIPHQESDVPWYYIPAVLWSTPLLNVVLFLFHKCTMWCFSVLCWFQWATWLATSVLYMWLTSCCEKIHNSRFICWATL